MDRNVQIQDSGENKFKRLNIFDFSNGYLVQK